MQTGSFALTRALCTTRYGRSFLISSIVSATFLFFMVALPVSAQTIAPAPDAAEAPAVVSPPPVAPADAGALAVSRPVALAEVTRDETITHEDLGTVPATVLPDSPFHFFKRFGRGVQEAFTFDPVRDAELKLKHANQQLAECKQMIEERGIANVDPSIIRGAIGDFNDKIGEVNDTARALKSAKVGQPEVVDRLLNEVTDKQLKQQKVLDVIAKEALQTREDAGATGGTAVGRRLEEVLTTVDETKADGIAGLADMLVGVEDSSQNIGVRITNVMDRQSGSEFKDLKNLEVLKAMQTAVPENVKSAIEVARKNTLEKFEARVKELPPVVRAEKLKLYVEQAASDETKLLALLNDIKASPTVPSDILSKLEEAKEIVARKFEKKLQTVEDPRVEQRLLDRFDSTEVGDLVALEEFASRMKAGSEELKQMRGAHQKSLDAFKKTFTEAAANGESAQFQKISRELLNNPTPKTFALVVVLKQDGSADASQTAFLSKIGEDMQRQFENQFRREGDKFMDRVATLDPNDLAVFGSFNFDKQFTDRLAKRNADKFKEFMKTVDDPEHFDQFRERFFDAPPTVINQIRDNDAQFQEVMQFKVRKMEQVKAEKEREIARSALDYKERELYHQTARVDRKAEDKFWEEFNQLPPDAFDERKVLWEQKINDAYGRVEERFNEQRKIFEERMKNDPWCDETCQQIQLQFVEQDARHQKERLADDLSREQRRIEFDKARSVETNRPFVNVCDTPESCQQYCLTNPGATICKGYLTGPVVQVCHYPSYWDGGKKACVTPENVTPTIVTTAQSCPMGQYWDFAKNACVTDPYYRVSTVQSCSYGMHWNDRSGSCELDSVFIGPTTPDGRTGPNRYPTTVFCGQGFRWDEGRRECVQTDFQQCGPGQYYDFYEQRCKGEWKDCGAGSYWDAGRSTCVKNTVTVIGNECPTGFTRDATGACVANWTDNVPIYSPCYGANEVWNPITKKCEQARQIEYCTQEYSPVCGTDNATYSNACYAKQAGVAVKTQGACVKVAPITSCTVTKYNPSGSRSCDQSICPNGCNFDFNGCPNGCALRPTPCPAGQTWDYLTKTCTGGGACKTYCDPSCDWKGGSYCVFDAKGCATSCSPSCSAGSMYFEDIAKCSTPQEYNKLKGCPAGQYYDKYLQSCRDQYCPTGWKWDEVSYTCVSSTDPSCKSTCNPVCGGGTGTSGSSYCLFDTKGCATGCSPTCPENQWYDTTQKKCVSYYTPTTCSDNGYNSGSGSSSCNYSKCPSGCNYDDKGCPASCYSSSSQSCGNFAGGTCPSGYTCVYPSYSAPNVEPMGTCTMNTSGYCGDRNCSNGETTTSCPTDCGSTVCPSSKGNNYKSGSYSCSNTVCPSGCNYDSSGCPTDCYDPNYKCSANTLMSSTSPWTCSWSACPNGCNYDSKGCATTCTSPADKCKNMTGWHYDSTTNTCVKDGITCKTPTACSACPSGSTSTSSWCNWDQNGCPTGCQTGSTGTCDWDKICDSGETATSCWNDCGGGGGCRAYTSETSCKSASCTWYNHADGIHCDDAAHGGPTGTCNANKVCDSGETAASCPADCSSTYPGDANSCPGFAYSNWDSKGVRYCKLNNSFKCEYSYPAYLTESNYTAAECPSPLITDPPAGCGDRICSSTESTATCPMDCGSTTTCASTKGNNYTSGSTCNYTNCPSGCNFDPSTSCPLDCYDPNYKCSANPYMQTTSPWTCNWSTCTNGCDYDSKGCATKCKASTTSSCPGTIANNYVAGSKTCYNTTCKEGCNYDTNSCPTTCWTMSNGYCGDKICQSNEGSSTCPGDCGGTSACTPNVYNANTSVQWACDSSTYCKSGCTFDTNGCATSCKTDGACSPNIYNNNATAIWSCDNSYCKSGCHFTSNGCADSCSTTSGTCVSAPMNNNSTAPWSCSASMCPNGCDYNASGCATACKTGACNYNNVCDSGESTATCPGDCKSGSTCPVTSYTTSAGACNYTNCPSGCTFDGTGCPSGCMTSSGYCGDYVCNNGETASTCASDCGGTGGGATCAANSYSGNTTVPWACTSSTCPNGCDFDSNGCATGCKTVATCPSNGYNSGTGSYSCNYSTCPNGCTYDGSGCPTACQPSVCSDNGFNMPGTATCDYAKCSSGCNWTNGCPSTCYTPTPTAGGFFRRLGSLLYALITLPARAFGL